MTHHKADLLRASAAVEQTLGQLDAVKRDEAMILQETVIALQTEFKSSIDAMQQRFMDEAKELSRQLHKRVRHAKHEYEQRVRSRLNALVSNMEATSAPLQTSTLPTAPVLAAAARAAPAVPRHNPFFSEHPSRSPSPAPATPAPSAPLSEQPPDSLSPAPAPQVEHTALPSSLGPPSPSPPPRSSNDEPLELEHLDHTANGLASWMQPSTTRTVRHSPGFTTQRTSELVVRAGLVHGDLFASSDEEEYVGMRDDVQERTIPIHRVPRPRTSPNMPKSPSREMVERSRRQRELQHAQAEEAALARRVQRLFPESDPEEDDDEAEADAMEAELAALRERRSRLPLQHVGVSKSFRDRVLALHQESMHPRPGLDELP